MSGRGGSIKKSKKKSDGTTNPVAHQCLKFCKSLGDALVDVYKGKFNADMESGSSMFQDKIIEKAFKDETRQKKENPKAVDQKVERAIMPAWKTAALSLLSSKASPSCQKKFNRK